ncbi:MAG TPA: sigma-70 family RNA polymerase sigma factor [Actinophytocola sp.]|uniref:sigma-70 family RNA polymerase sigma factor n=1 Tax=Actinophytocola sp. TaxID=1872138 RepID=UPI002F93621F
MDEGTRLAERFTEQRPRLRAVAYRMLGSFSEADDAVQEAWLRLNRTGADGIDNLAGWLTTVVARVCLNMLRARESRREESLEVRLPDPVVSSPDGPDPEQEALLADSVGLALLVVLDSLGPAERLAFVLHDMFAVPFEDIAAMLDRSPAATRQLASRARRRVRGEAPVPDPDLSRQREVVTAFFAAAREGDFETLISVLDPDIELRSDGGPGRPRLNQFLRGPQAVAGQARGFRHFAGSLQPVLVNGAAAVLVVLRGQPMAVMAFTVTNGRIVAINVLLDPKRLAALELPAP